ncbi:hypothetical protein N7490_006774 [Penicillium lividum]|nr:hypothetical protein N7490_006774 [Penicillium lividum]
MSYYGNRDLREPQSRDRDKLRIITIHNRLNDTTLHSATIFATITPCKTKFDVGHRQSEENFPTT